MALTNNCEPNSSAVDPKGTNRTGGDWGWGNSLLLTPWKAQTLHFEMTGLTIQGILGSTQLLPAFHLFITRCKHLYGTAGMHEEEYTLLEC